jgi:plastocyanin
MCAMRHSRPLVASAVACCAALLLLAAPAGAASVPKRTSASVKLSPRSTVTTNADGTQHYHYAFGPVKIAPGQNNIFIEPNKLKPKVPGYITSFAPNLVEKDGTIPRVDVIHLHHAVWLINGAPVFAAGEEKTVFATPPGYGYAYKPTDKWQMNHMIHNLTPTADTVYITYDLDFVPASLPAAAKMTPVTTQWMDVEAIKPYPVFDAVKGTGKTVGGRNLFTFPDDAKNPYPDGNVRNVWTATKDVTLVGTAGHLHPGGLYTDLKVTRDGKTKLLFRSDAKYWEPAGAVSWDVSMTATPKNWKINLKAGDKLSVSGTYDTTNASWYESMAIMPVQVADGWHGVDPFASAYPTRGAITHGPLAENRNHGGGNIGLPNPLTLLDGPASNGKTLTIDNFAYSQGSLTATGVAGRVPTVQPGGTITFKNDDAPPGVTGNSFASPNGQTLPIYHTITSCQEPCNKATGIAYPLAGGKATFDSGELGYGQRGITPAKNTDTWTTPKNLKPGTYEYFCRVHPFMRGAFRVVKLKD